MDDVYRVQPPKVLEPAPAARLIRFTGCDCRPPSGLWCWWHDVVEHDVWQCEHGKRWKHNGYRFHFVPEGK